MSALRINLPGQPIRYIELGPARARMSSSPYTSMGGQIELVRPRPSHEKRAFRIVVEHQAKAIVAEMEEEIRRNKRCGYLMPVIQERCARRPHDSRDHRSAVSVANDRLRRNRGGA